MASDFEKMMNEKMDNASLKDVLPDFDKAATWSELENRLPEKKSKPLFAWWTHAAAVVAGILLGGFALQTIFNHDTNTEPIIQVAQEKQTTVPAEVIVKTDTVFITKEVMPAEPIAKPVHKAVTPQPQPKEVIAKEETKKPVKTEKALPVVEDIIAPKQEEVVAQAKPKKVKPIHLLDIDNEDRQDALYNNDPEDWKRSGFTMRISSKRLPNNNNQREPSLLNGLFKND